MKCPTCQVDLVMSERQGVEIDYCPQCRGVWLDRGELDKIIEKSAGGQPAQAAQQHYQEPRPQQQYQQPHSQHSQPHHKPHKKENFLMDLFDF